MNAQNIYDDPDFQAGYVTLDRQVRGLDGASEWPVLRSLLPDLEGRRVVDLGCGFGWFSRWADEHHAASVLGLDLSTKMLDRARTDTASATVEYRRSDLDVLDLDPGSAEVVFSSLTLHYVQHLDRLLETIALSLTPGGSLVFSVEHPILSAPSIQGFETSATGDRFWKLDNYLVEGERVRTWFVDGVVKQHRTVATYVNSVVGSGLTIERLVEWGPTAVDVEVRPELADDLHRPWFLLLAALKPGNQHR
jgi:SAM-dependent methyltransferase